MIENHSTSQQDLRVRLYASTDLTIDTNDILLDTSLYTMGASTEYASHRVFQLPASFNTGNIYWFGYIVDKPYNTTPDDFSGNDDVVRYNNLHVIN